MTDFDPITETVDPAAPAPFELPPARDVLRRDFSNVPQVAAGANVPLPVNPKQAYDALRTQGNAAYDSMSAGAGAAFGNRFIADRQAATEVQAKQQELQLRRDAAAAAAAKAAGAGGGLTGTPISPIELIRSRVVQKFGKDALKDDATFSQYISLLDEDDQRKLIDDYALRVGMYAPADKDNPAIAAGFDAMARDDMLTALTSAGLAGPDDRSTSEKLIGGAITLGGSAIGGVGDLIEGVDTVLGGNFAETEIGQTMLGWTKSAAKGSLSPQTRQEQQAVQTMMAMDMPTTDIVERVFTSPGLMTAYFGNFVGQMAPFGLTNVLARVGARALGTAEARGLIAAAEGGAATAADAKAVNALRRARAELTGAVQRGAPAGKTIEELTRNVRAAEAVVAKTTARTAAAAEAAANPLLKAATTGTAAQMAAGRVALRESLQKKVLESMTKSAINASTIGLVVAAAGQYGMSKNQVRDTITALPLKDLLVSDENQRIFEAYAMAAEDRGMTPEGADAMAAKELRRVLTDRAQEASAGTAALSAGITALPLLSGVPGLGKLFAGMGTVERLAAGVEGKMAGDILTRPLKGAGFEATQEGVQSGIEQVAANEAALTDDATAAALNVEDKYSNVLTQSIIGAGVGGLAGGVAGGFAGPRAEPAVQVKKDPLKAVPAAIKGTQGTATPAAPAAPAGPGAAASVVSAPNSAQPTVSTDTPAQATARAAVGDAATEAVVEATPDDIPAESKSWWKSFNTAFGYKADKTPSKVGAKPNAASLFTFSSQWAAQAENENANLDARNKLFAPFMDASGALVDTKMVELLGVVEEVKTEFDAVADGGKGKGRGNADAMRKNYAPLNLSMADADMAISNLIMERQAAAQTTPTQENPDVQTTPTEELTSLEQLGQLVPDGAQTGRPDSPAQTGRVQQLRDGTGKADVFTPQEITARAAQPFAVTPETVHALIRGLGKRTDMLRLKRDSTINPRGLALLKAYNAALARGVSPAELANVLNALPDKGKIDGERLTLARQNIQALQAPVAPAAGGAVEDTELGKPPTMMSSVSPTSSGSPTAASAALDAPPTYLPGMGNLEGRKAAMGQILNAMPIMQNNDFVLVDATNHTGMIGELDAKLSQMVAQGKMTRAEANQMAADAMDHASGIPFDPLGFVLNSRGLHPLVVFNYGSPMYDASSSVTHVALHETAGHLGLRGLAAGREDLRVSILNMAARNKTVRELANALAPVWKLDVKTMDGWHAALEEALSELAAVGFTRGGLDQLSKTYGTNLTKNFSAKLENEDATVLQRVIQMLRDAWDAVTNLNITDADVRSVLASMNLYANSTTEARMKIRARAVDQLTVEGTPRVYVNSLGKTGSVVTLYGAGDFNEGIDEIPNSISKSPDELNARQGDGFTGQNALDIVFPTEMVNALHRQDGGKPLARRAWKKGSQAVETLFNSNWGLLREKEYIVRNGGQMNEDLDFYLAAVRAGGVSSQNNEVDNQNVINPALDRLADLYRDSGLSAQMTSEEFYIAVSDYIMAKHAQERNTTFYYEFVELENEDANLLRNKLLSEMRVTGMPTNVYMNRLRNIVLAGKPVDVYSDNGTNYSGMTNTEAQNYLVELEEQGITAEIGEAANGMMEEMRAAREQRALESGVFGRAGTNVQQTRGWKYYLPLRGKGTDRDVSEDFEEDYEEGPTTIGSRGTYSLYGAQGRSTKADNGIEALRGDIMVYGRRAGTRQYHATLLRAMDANADIMGVSIAILDYDAVAGMYKHRATGEYIKDLVPFSKGTAGERMLVVQSADNEYDPARNNNDTKYVIRFPNSRDGGDGVDSDILRALAAEKRQAVTPMLADSGIGNVTGFVAKAQTSLNPFWMLMTSWVRDTTGYPAILTARLGLKEGARVSSLYAASLAQNHLAGPMKVLFNGPDRRSLKDVREMAKEEGSWAYYYQKLMDLGGINSFDSQFETSAEDAFSTQFKKETKLSGVKNAFDSYSRLAGTWADGLEASHRVALFKAMLDAGYTESAAAGLTKDLLNFQQVGSAGRDINTFIQFYKTSAASIDSMVRSFRKDDGTWDKAKAVQLGGVLALGGALLTIFSAGMMGDDDEGEPYANRVRPDDWAKGMLVPTGDGSYRRIDVGLGFGGLAFGLGALSARLAQGQMESGEYAASLFNVINRNAAPIQAAGVGKDATADEFAAAMAYGWAMPSLFRPIVDITANRNNFGGNIYQNPAFTQGKADAFSGRPSTPDFFSDITQSVFKATNGTIDAHPETLEYLISSYLGSMARMGMTFADIAHAEATGGVARKSGIDPFILPGVDTNRNWATDRMYNMQSDLDLAKARTGGEVAGPAEAASAAFTDEINSIKSAHSKEMRKVRSNQLLSADARRARIKALEADLNRKMILLEDQVERAKAAAR
jgi:Large polyvalent protein associated domain 38